MDIQEKLPTRAKRRISELKEAYIEDELSEKEFDTLLDAAFDDGPPFRTDWFMRQPESRRKRYAEKNIYVYCGDEYVVEDDFVVAAREEDLGTRNSRTISVTGNIPDEDEIEEIEREEVELSDEAKAKQAELRERLGLDSRTRSSQ